MKILLHIQQLKFKPRLATSLATLLLVSLFIGLSIWQFHRYEQKIAWQTKIEQNNTTVPMTLKSLQEELLGSHPSKDSMVNIPKQALEIYRYRTIEASGYFLKQHFLLDNQIYKGRAGYHVLTPLLTHEGFIFLVDRGWIPLGISRDHLPTVDPIEEKVKIIASLQLPSKPWMIKKEPSALHEFSHMNPIRIQFIDFELISKILNRSIPSVVLKIAEQQPYGFGISMINFNPQANKHLGYSLQWFTMALVTLIYYLLMNTKRIKP